MANIAKITQYKIKLNLSIATANKIQSPWLCFELVVPMLCTSAISCCSEKTGSFSLSSSLPGVDVIEW